MDNTIVGVDLAKRVIQVCIYTNKKVHSNIEMTSDEFLLWLFQQKPVTIIFEACSGSNYWKQKAIEAGHKALLISAQLVSTVRQNQKTDKNDALAIIQASQLAEIGFINGKTHKQQQLQTILKLRELAVKHQTALRNQLVALLAEFNIHCSSRNGGIKSAVANLLEDFDNGFTCEFRATINAAYGHLIAQSEIIEQYNKQLEHSIEQHEDCKRLLRIEGVGPINAINLYVALGCGDIGTFKRGKDASACIGLTPKQYSSGGIIKLGAIGSRVKHGRLRSQLIVGAMAVVTHLAKRTPKTKKECWLMGLIERKGKKCAAVALANKTVRTAFAMLRQGTEYKAELLAA